MASSILKDTFHNSIADSVYKEAMTNVSKYYYYLGRTTPWFAELSPSMPVESAAYEREIRDNIILVKEIKPTEIAYVIPRINWRSGEIYDQYDDQYSTEIQGVDLSNGGSGYSIIPNVYIGSTGSQAWSANTAYIGGELLSVESRFYIVTSGGITSDVQPTHTSGSSQNGSAILTSVAVNDGGGSGAIAQCTIFDGSVIDIQVTNRGYGYTSHPTVIIAGVSGSGAMATAVITFGSKTNSQRLETTESYVMTDEFYVYQCLNNNNGGVSTVKPTGTDSNPFKTADGYIWKLLYLIPVSMRNRFLTSTYVPVASALTDQFYSAGSIQNISLINRGSGYNSASISVIGDGYLEANPRYLTGVNITNPGADYSSSPIVYIQPPFSGAIPWVAETFVTSGTKISQDNRIYEVIKAGELGTIAPDWKGTYTVDNGSATLKFIGETPSYDITVVAGEVTDFTLYGDVAEINVVNGGSGYSVIPSISVEGDGSSTIASAVIKNGSIQNIIIHHNGSDYTTTPTVIIGTEWSASTAVYLGEQFFYGNNLYTVTVAGTTGTTAPTHVVGSASNGTATLQYAGKKATATAKIKYGSGYSFSPTVEITDGTYTESAVIEIQSTKTDARLLPIFDNGEITAVEIIDGGVGYTYASLSVVGDGQDAEIIANLSIGDITTLQSNIELLTVDGQIVNIPVISSGYGYSIANISIVGDGVGATAEAVINNGRILKINVTNFGSGYRKANIVITGNGYGAKARAILSPYGGFGKRAVKALNARTLMFCTNIFLDVNQGFGLDNDYRQVGIIKGFSKYQSTLALSQQITTPCWVIGSQSDLTQFNNDDVITSSTGFRFKIISRTQNAILCLSLDNSEPVIGQTMTLGVSSFVVSSITEPNMDKYSGDMLFVDNKYPFVPSPEQRVTLRTVIEF